jgi:hypothetical protein
MSVGCKDLDRILKRQRPEELAALETHAQGCAHCRRHLELERELSLAARSLRREDTTPQLWARIARVLQAEAERSQARKRAWIPLQWLAGFSESWRVAAATVALVVLCLTGTWTLLQSLLPRPPVVHRELPSSKERLLTEQRLQDVQKAEAEYLKSIDRLAELAEPKLRNSPSPLMVNYKEKLLVLDAAIAECRALIDQNPYNAHLRNELRQVYQAKKTTLDEILREN